MFKIILLFGSIILSVSGNAQNSEYILDPFFPAYIEGENNIEMQKYAKTHPPAPFEDQFETDELYQLKLDEWLRLNPYYPQLIPYHLYKGGLTLQDDVLFLENAKTIWKNAHQEIVEKVNR